MIDYSGNLVSALNKVLPTYYEMALTNKCKLPCISWMELNNYVEANGDTLGYSRVRYQIKVWGKNISEIQKYALMVDLVLRPLGFTRVSTGELYDPSGATIQKIMTYEALAHENY